MIVRPRAGRCVAALAAALAPTAAACAPAPPGGSGATGAPLRVVTWNVENLFNDLPDGTAQETLVSSAEYAAKRAAVVAVLSWLSGDVVVLQEVENLAVLEDLAADLGDYPHRALVEGNDPRGIDVGALARVPFEAVVSHRDDLFRVAGTTSPTYRFARDCLELHLRWNQRRVALLGVHFRSKEQDDPAKRLAEAQRTREVADGITAADPTAAVAVLGDFNDVPGSPPYLAVAGAAPDLYRDAADLVAAEDRWTFEFQGSRELIDHVMANPTLAARLAPERVVIPHGPEVAAASDHAPVAASYPLEPP